MLFADHLGEVGRLQWLEIDSKGADQSQGDLPERKPWHRALGYCREKSPSSVQYCW